MTPAASLTTPNRQATTTKRRTAGSKRVYGKRKANAPRAVFEQRSPARDAEKVTDRDTSTELNNAAVDGDDPVDGLQAKMASVTIETAGSTTQRPEEEQIAVEVPVFLKEEVESPYAPEPEVEAQSIAEDRNEQSPKETTFPAPVQYQTMVGVRISTRKPAAASDEQHTSPQDQNPTTERKKRATTATTRKKKPAQRLSSGCVQDEKSNEYCRAILNEALSPIAAQGVQKFSSWAARGGNMLQVVKIAEGSYGEVYKMRLREEVCEQAMSKSKFARLRAYGDGVFKVVPLRAAKGPGSKKFTSVDEIVSEVRMLKFLDPIPGFARFREIHVVQGRFPESLQDAWDYYKKTKDDCMNPNPSSKRAYPDTQMWAIIEMDDAGCELEKFPWSSVFQIYDIFWGVAMALARSEEYALFEHRDLHLGNVCIRTTRSDNCMDPPTDLEVVSRPHSSGYGLSTLETTIIDYSLSRAELRFSEDPNAPIDVASSDLDKKQIFDAIGQDEDEALLRDTYRHMRAQVYTGNPENLEKHPDVQGIWSEYAPGTNLVWLRFLLKNLLKNRKNEAPPTKLQRKPLAPCSPNKQNTVDAKQRKDKDGKQKHLGKQIHTAEAGLQATQWKKVLEDRLEAVLELLDFEHGHEDMCCAADLVAYAIDSQWLDERDFF